MDSGSAADAPPSTPEPDSDAAIRNATPENAPGSEATEATPPSLWDGFLSTLRGGAAPTESSTLIQDDTRPSDRGAASPAPAIEPPEPADESTVNQERSTVQFRLPVHDADGAPIMLSFNPQPLPPGIGHTPQPQQQAHPPGLTAIAEDPLDHQRHPAGHFPVNPLFVPLGASPLPFAFIYDTASRTAWPIVDIRSTTQPGDASMPGAPGAQQHRLVAGPPFQIILNFNFAAAPPEPEQPDPERAAKYVNRLERADAELRSRMVRLGLGSIGGSDEGDQLLGCGVCLDNYDEEDRPEWLDGRKSQDTAVVAVPCAGHHTLHAGCLRDWLSNISPSQWSCPFCRASLKDPSTTSGKSVSHTATLSHQTLREVVRQQERKNGWRCDAPACLPRYPASSKDPDSTDSPDILSTHLVTLAPCKHAVHLDCLSTSTRVANEFVDADITVEDADTNTEAIEGKDTVGKWVTCPACRKEAWAVLPLCRKPQSAPKVLPQSTLNTREEESVEALLK